MPVVSFAWLLNKESVETIVIIVPEALDLPTIQIIHNSPRSYTIYFDIQVSRSVYLLSLNSEIVQISSTR